MLPSWHRHLPHPRETLVCHVSLRREVEGRVDDASSADTTPARHSALQTARGDVEEMKGQWKAELVPEDDYVRAEGPWHSVNVDGQVQQ